MFELLKKEILDDVEKRRAHFGGSPIRYFEFRFIPGDTQFAVLVEGNKIHDTVTFELTDSAIQVLDNERRVKMQATPTICDDGQCRLKVNGQERELWQFRKIALEELFFRKYV
jgi:hypothetical protein